MFKVVIFYKSLYSACLHVILKVWFYFSEWSECLWQRTKLGKNIKYFSKIDER